MKILIFTTSSSNGHNSATKRIKEKFLQGDSTTAGGESAINEISLFDVDGLKSITTKYGTSFTIYVTPEAGYSVIGCTIDDETNVDVSYFEGSYFLTFNAGDISITYPRIGIYFSQEQ